jgi:hypothetical protein
MNKTAVTTETLQIQESMVGSREFGEKVNCGSAEPFVSDRVGRNSSKTRQLTEAKP